jgi:hypothetical protein
MQEYIHMFCELVDQFQAYSTTTDHVFYTTNFIYGLRDDIKYLISIQRPKNLDTACCLALLQDENNLPQARSYKAFDGAGFSRNSVRGAFPLPRPPVANKVETNTNDKNKSIPTKGSLVEEKLAALSTYRMAKGLCRKCGEK